MNQKKIGNFISTIRKEKNMTQKDLSEKLNVSINAVSKWERGICLMDISLLKPLSELLEISIIEIINGEKLNKNELTNEMIEKTINYYEKKIIENKKKKCKIFFWSLIIILLLSLLTYKVILLYNIKSIENNITEYIDFSGEENYHESSIHILKKDVDNYYTFKDMKIKNIFENNIEKHINKYVESYVFLDDKTISLEIVVDDNNMLDELDNTNLVKYMYKNNLNNDRELYKFLSKFEFSKVSLFNSIVSLKEYLNKLVFYNLYSFTFDDYYDISGSFDGNIIINDDIIIYELKAYYNKYKIMFKGYNFDETLKIIETINFVE